MSVRVAVVAGCRTPFARAGSALSHMTPVQLGTVAVRELIDRAELDRATVDGLIFGTVLPSILAPNVAREITLESGLPATVQGFTVGRACASANQAITSAAESIMHGYGDVYVAGGVEILSDVPMLFSRSLRDILLSASKAKSLGARMKVLARIRPRDLAPVTPAIAEPSTGETMGESAERMAKENGITRADQDRWALRSHRLAAQGTADDRLTAELVPTFIPPKYEHVIDRDNGIRTDTTAEKMAALKPVFDRRYGTVTAGNSSPLTDGASAVLLMSEARAKSLGYEPLGYIRSWHYTALSPKDQLLQGPAYATPVALDRAGMSMNEIGLWEIHEAFAAQVLSNLQAMDSDTFAREKLGRDRKTGIIDEDRINVMGGSIAIGHPFGATGARLTITLLNEMKRRDVAVGLVTVCAAGALGFAMVLER